MRLYTEWVDGTSRDQPVYDLPAGLEQVAHEIRAKAEMPMALFELYDSNGMMLLFYHHEGVNEDQQPKEER